MLCLWNNSGNGRLWEQSISWIYRTYGHRFRIYGKSDPSGSSWKLWRTESCFWWRRQSFRYRTFSASEKSEGTYADHVRRNDDPRSRWQSRNRRDYDDGRIRSAKWCAAWEDLSCIYAGRRDWQRGRSFWCRGICSRFCLYRGRRCGRRDRIRKFQCLRSCF